MRQHSRWLRLLAVFLGLSLVAAACGDDDDDTEAEEEDGGDQAAGDVEADPATDRLVIGRVLPDTGPLAFLGPPMIVGVNLAVEDINAAGGVLDQDVDLLEADEGETPQTAREGVVRMLGEGANAIVGAAASTSSQEFIQILSDNEIPECSGSNTAPDFTDQENADFYFRTVPGDLAVAPVIADRVVADGHANVAIVARADDYGQGLAEAVQTELESANVNVATSVTYDPEAATFDAEVEEVVGAEPDAIVLIAFDEGGQVAAGLLERGITPDQLYGSDGVFGPTLPELVSETDPNIIDGMTVVGASGGEEFNQRIAEPTDNNFIYGAQTYDCAIILALAAEAADSVAGPDIIEQIQAVTGDGTACTSYEECKGLLDDGEDIDYNGASGDLDLDEPGDPTSGRYAIGQFQDGELTIVDSIDVQL
jgi:ABC-type branched-subunit amino acid transport system substrate-binding protein